jgi:two-component system chemotaxis sensor kinase CheA
MVYEPIENVLASAPGLFLRAPGPEPDRPDIEKIEATLDTLSSLAGAFCPGEISDLGRILNTLRRLVTEVENCGLDEFSEVSGACITYVEKMLPDKRHPIGPVESGLILLKALARHFKKGVDFNFDTADILESLSAPVGMDKSRGLPEEISAQDIQESENPSVAVEPISDDDMEILTDFVLESEENLDAIEVHLIVLEQDPSNMEIINDIFRPFHTIKGVSGFLGLTKINRLAHATENLLDAARSGAFLINAPATNAILESVDTLKHLIAGVKQGIENRVRQADDDIDVDVLLEKLQHLTLALARGNKAPLGEILVKKGVVDQEIIEQSLKIQQTRPDLKIGEILVAEKKASPNEIAAALTDQKNSNRKADAQVKVSTQKLDDLVDYAGELVIAQSMLKQKTSHDPSLNQSVAHLGQIVSNMQAIAMSLRMIPIKATFMKMVRLVRDLSQKTGKEVSLQMKGEETEIDRNVVEALYEPMVHMIRNSVDHGIEPESERHEKNKPARGSVILRAYHKGGFIIIEIEDDGRGLDQDRIREKAVGAGLIPKNAKLTEAQIYDLILQPGFSTAEKITDVSGRGVGMDVVKAGIEKFRGRLNIESLKDKGTKFTISLPLTLAIIDGMLVRVGDQRYVIPTTAVQRAFKPVKEACFTVERKGEMVKEKDHLIPLIRLNELYGKKKSLQPVWESLVIVVESEGEERALLIDELLGKDEYVIKSLGPNLEGIKGFAGGAILSDGRVGLILDVHGIFEIASKG